MLLQIKNLSMVRGASHLSFADIALGKNESMLLLGPSGSGKTTLLSIIAGLLTPYAGQVLFDGNDMYQMQPSARDRLRGRSIGFVFQNFHLLPSLTVSQNILLAARMIDMPADNQRLQNLLDMLGLTDKADHRPQELSQGERQRAAIARAVYNRPSLLVADEPTSALDDENSRITIDLLRSQARESGAALLLATHDHRITAGFDKTVHLDRQTKVAA